MESDDSKAVLQVVPYVEQESAQRPVQINYWGRSVDMYYVQESELESIGTANNESTLYMAFCGISIGVALAMIGILSQVEIANEKIYATCWAVLFVSSVGSVLLGIKGVMCHVASRTQINRIKSQSKPTT